MFIKLRTYLFILAISGISILQGHAQIENKPDSLNIKSDTLSIDSIQGKTEKKKSNDFKSKVIYTANDSITYSADNKKAYMYGGAKVTYEDIELVADYIEYDIPNNTVFASGVKDSSGILVGKPDFKQGSQEFKSDTMKYNFKTQKGTSLGIITKQDDGYLHAERTKREANGNINIKNGKYTTCDAEHPHFYLALTKGVVIPNNKIVSGPAYIVFEDVPIPLGIPFGFFPNRRESTSGILIPSYGEEITRGFYLSNGGYYFAFSDYFDMRLTGDLYSKGTWGTNVASRYVKRYKYSGDLSARYYINKNGEKGVEFGSDQLQKSRDFSIRWSHTKDAKSSPSSRFSASVNYSSSSFDRNHNYTDSRAMVTNTKQSSISYSKNWDKMNLSINMLHDQNSRDKSVTMTLPITRFDVTRLYPFRTKNSAGDKWYQNISINYSSELTNIIQAADSTIFTAKALRDARKGFQHSIPLSANFKVLKFLNISPSLSYSGMLKTEQVLRTGKDSTHIGENGATKFYYYEENRVQKLSYVQGFTPSISLNLNPTIYGYYTLKNKKSKVKVVRHLVTPSVGFNFVPNIDKLVPNYYQQYKSNVDKDGNDVMTTYSIYDGTQYGTPSVPRRSGSFSFGLNNSVEMKVKSDKDTVTGLKKIMLLQSLNFTSSYNIYQDSMNLTPIRFSGSIPIVEGIDFSFSGTLNPYENDAFGRDINKFYWKNHIMPGRLTDFSTGFGYNFQSSQGKKTDEGGDKSKKSVPKETDTDYNYFDIPWNFQFNYIFNYQNNGVVKNVTQTLQFSGDIKITKKWGTTFSSGYDFKSKEFSYTAFTITRDLHCWELTVNFCPFGNYKFYNFTIRPRSSILKDLKYEKRKDYRDFSGYSAY